jgi:hypothetical protein
MRAREDRQGDTEEAILEAVAEGPRKSREVKTAVAGELNVGVRTVDRAAKALVDRGELVVTQGDYPRTTTWALSSGATAQSRQPNQPDGATDGATEETPLQSQISSGATQSRQGGIRMAPLRTARLTPSAARSSGAGTQGAARSPGLVSPPPHAEVARLASRQWGVVSRAQLLALGISCGALEHWLSVGRLQLLYRGVYAVGHRSLRVEGWRLAAVLACGPGAVLSHRTAAAHWGLLRTDQTRIDVTTRRGRHGAPGIRLHRSRSLDEKDTTRHQGIRPRRSAARCSTSRL